MKTTGGFQTFLGGAKDAAIAIAIRSLFNSKYGRFGQMTHVAVDTAKRELHVRIELAGEVTPIEIHVENYRIEEQGARATVTIGDATSSREWMTELLREFVVGRTFDLPERAAAVVKLVT